MTSALAATYSVQKDAIDVHAGNITDAEQHEGVGRHMRVDFTNQTSFTVAAVDLPTNFEPGNGMVQVFQDMGSNKFRNLIAPASYDASTGVITYTGPSAAQVRAHMNVATGSGLGSLDYDSATGRCQ